MTQRESTSQRSNTADEAEAGAVLAAGLDSLVAESRRIGGMAALAAAEAKLSLQGFALTIAIGVFAAGVALVTWGLLMALVIAQVIAYGISVSGILFAMLVVHIAALIAAVFLVNRTGTSIGFPRLRQQLSAK